MKKHSDCMNFCAVDATKGICRLSKQMLNLDDEACEELKVMPKCKNCKNFVDVNDEGIGKCVGLEKEDWVYSTLNAITCEGHMFNE
ncbi:MULTISPECIES: 4-hydroxyphenylacetate decarboxylase small subunit [unclassified Clostridioides]|uniref:4-hydroxyphenylacetate decarboxylase small subunit n=1 Tax=unclassified Clostridioides TaxID=2635829 RepID=UPI0006BBF471|nr:MFS transporter [Clostridioides difficile]MCC0693766.1 4-hydroxyphenylacetate decarboxylase small subunit [Clostridioides sp. ZZV14-6387]MCI9976869.1 4-hydroxyphenylacetate decarboxylase small subunit [Clostridioides difficile]MDI0266882.1 4-hydroxyphenylacetate decarboxylase small subunit [Clostridioides difficile]CZR95415.1 4-hydroxyphenylacetate decarboxylase small subunit [Clostridioides difficile]